MRRTILNMIVILVCGIMEYLIWVSVEDIKSLKSRGGDEINVQGTLTLKVNGQDKTYSDGRYVMTETGLVKMEWYWMYQYQMFLYPFPLVLALILIAGGAYFEHKGAKNEATTQ